MRHSEEGNELHLTSKRARAEASRVARISCYVALAGYVFGGLSQLSPVVWSFLLAVEVTAFVLGSIGIAHGIRIGNAASVRWGLLGVLLSCCALVPVLLHHLAV